MCSARGRCQVGFRPRVPGSSDTLGIGFLILGKRSEGTVLCASHPHVTARFGQTSSPDRPRGNWSRIKHIPRVKRGQFLGVAYTPSTEKGPKRQVGERFQSGNPETGVGPPVTLDAVGFGMGVGRSAQNALRTSLRFLLHFHLIDSTVRPSRVSVLAHGCAAARRFPAW